MSTHDELVAKLVPGPGNDFIALEHRVSEFWDATDAFEALRRKNATGPRWSFLDGPITANNAMGVHHAWGRTLKDLYQRYHAMQGHHQRYQNGFDCQGLWVEVEVEKELGFRSKKDIEDYGLERFVEKCKARARHFADVITRQSRRLGVWMDWSDSYYTLADHNNYAIWGFLKRCHERGLVYKGLDAMPWCPRCGTGISQHEMHEGYHATTHTSLVIELPLRDREGALLVWTTTPWTLTSNVAAAVHPELDYACVRKDGKTYWLAESCVARILGDAERLEIVKGASLVDWRYRGPYDELEVPRKLGVPEAHRVIPWKDVAADEGTGIVHIAPGCGKEDFALGRALGLPAVAPIDEEGRFLPGFGFLTGRHASEVAPDVVDDMRRKGIHVRHDAYEHNYPHCWRCKTELLFRMVDEWFIAMEPWRHEIQESARQLRWIPDYGADLEQDWLRNMGDWMISKKRYWGLALPIWECASCGAFDVVGDERELEARAVAGWKEFEGHSPHRPWVDAVRIACTKCGAQAHRIRDVGNPWLDAGIVPYSTMYYFQDRGEWAKWFPADFITECFPGQFRNWFYAILAMSTMMEGRAPMKVLLGHALVRDVHGQEMHKSKGNAIWFDEAVEKAGADVMRWAYARQPTANNLNFGYEPLQVLRNRVFDTLWNVHVFYQTYARVDGFNPGVTAAPPAQERSDLDRWILSRLNSLTARARAGLEDYDSRYLAVGAEEFLEELSNWYLRQSRRRFWKSDNDDDKAAAYHTLFTCLDVLTRLCAPIAPFMTEAIYQHSVRAGSPAAEQAASVHHRPWPEADTALVDETLEQDMAAAAAIVSLGLSARNAASLKVRQPLSEVLIATGEDAVTARAAERFRELIRESLNVKGMRVVASERDIGIRVVVKANYKSLGPVFGKNMQKAAQVIAALDPAELPGPGRPTATITVDGAPYEIDADDVVVRIETPEGLSASRDQRRTVAVQTTLTEALRLEGLARDAVRALQVLRKDIGLNVDDRIHVRYAAADETLTRALQDLHDYAARELLAVTFAPGEPGTSAHEVPVQKTRLRVEVLKA